MEKLAVLVSIETEDDFGKPVWYESQIVDIQEGETYEETVKMIEEYERQFIEDEDNLEFDFFCCEILVSEEEEEGFELWSPEIGQNGKRWVKRID